MGYWEDYLARENLQKYGSNALLLYALQLKFDIDDIDSVAADAITDGPQDKKCDLIYLDENKGMAVVAQGYIRKNPSEEDIAKANKASDLNTASGWIFEREKDDLSEDIKDQVIALRNAIEKGSISTLYFWYVHNCKESQQVKDELQTVERAAKTLLSKYNVDNDISIYANEIGRETLEHWYISTTNTILVNDEIKIEFNGKGFELKGGNWKAYQTCISGKALYSLYKNYPEDLFSANPRRFLGIDRKAKSKIINAGIKQSAEMSASNFWVYNNGITALTHSYSIDNGSIICKGFSIINGAQTTGSIGSLESQPDDNLLVSLRIIECTDADTIRAIIDNNNKQNEMLPSDFRSNDLTQRRLREDFKKYPEIVYNGGLRKAQSVRGKEVLDHFSVGQALMAFRGEPVTAYGSKVDIWSDDKLYGSIFDENLTAEHIILVYSLSKAIDQVKVYLKQQRQEKKILSKDLKKLEFLRKRGSRVLLLSTVARNLETLTEASLGNIQRLKFKDNSSFENCQKLWVPIVNMVLSFCDKLEPALSGGGLDSKEKSISVMQEVGESIGYTNEAVEDILKRNKEFLCTLEY